MSMVIAHKIGNEHKESSMTVKKDTNYNFLKWQAAKNGWQKGDT